MNITNNFSHKSVVTPAFSGHHLHKNFESMMNHIYKSTPDIFEHSNVMRVSTVLDNGLEVVGTANFANGRYKNLKMDEGFSELAGEFKRTALRRYNSKMAKGRTKAKLGYLA